MSERASIRREGENAEARFKRITGAIDAETPGQGDARLLINEVYHHVEIKECHKLRTERGTINQVRAIKCIPCVIHAPKYPKNWCVLPPQEVIRIAASRDRGQHTEIPFESMSFNLAGVCTSFFCEEDELLETTRKAIVDSATYQDILDIMGELMKSIIRVREEYRKKVVRAFDEPR